MSYSPYEQKLHAKKSRQRRMRRRKRKLEMIKNSNFSYSSEKSTCQQRKNTNNKAKPSDKNSVINKNKTASVLVVSSKPCKIKELILKLFGKR